MLIRTSRDGRNLFVPSGIHINQSDSHVYSSAWDTLDNRVLCNLQIYAPSLKTLKFHTPKSINSIIIKGKLDNIRNSHAPKHFWM